MEAVIICNKPQKTLSSLSERRNAAGCFILGKSILESVIESVIGEGITDITVAVSETGDETGNLARKLKDKYNLRVIATDQNSPAVVRKAWQGDEMLVIECKGEFLYDIKNLRKIHKNHNSPLTVLVKCQLESPFELLSDSSTGFSYIGVYILSQEVVASIPLETKTESMAELVELNPKAIGVSDFSDSIEIKTPAELLLANKKALENACRYRKDLTEISEGYYNKSGKFLRGVTIIPPVYVGENTVVGRGTVLDSGTVLCDNVTVGDGCYIKGSTVCESTVIGDRTSLDNALVDRGVTVMKGVTLKKMSVVGTKTTIANDTVVESGVRIYSGKKISPQITVCDDVDLCNDGIVLFDDDGAITDLQGFVTPAFCAQLGSAIASSVMAGSRIVVSSGGKKSALYLADSLSAGIASAGVNVWRITNATKGELAFVMDRTETDLGVEVNVDFKTSVRLYSKGAIKISQAQESQIEENLNMRLSRRVSSEEFGEVINGQEISRLYPQSLERLLPSRFSGINVKVRTTDVKLAQLADKLFHIRNDVNGETVTFHINNSEEGISAYSEKTGYIFGEKLMLIALKFHLAEGNDLSLPETFPDVAEKITDSFPGSILRYSLSPRKNDKHAKRLAERYENLFINDPLFLCVKIISIMHNNKLSLKELSQDLPQFYSTRRFVAVESKNGNFTTTVKRPENNSRAVIRPIKNSKGYMIYAQSVNAETATALCDEIERKLKAMDN